LTLFEPRASGICRALQANNVKGGTSWETAGGSAVSSGLIRRRKPWATRWRRCFATAAGRQQARVETGVRMEIEN